MDYNDRSNYTDSTVSCYFHQNHGYFISMLLPPKCYLNQLLFYGFINLLMILIYISKALKYIIHRLKMELNELFGNEGNLSWHYMHFMQNNNIHNTRILKVIY